MNFSNSITLAFKDAFSSGFSKAQNSLAGMKGALGEINRNQEMNRLASDLSMMTSATEPMRQALTTALDQPARIAGNLESSLKNVQSVTGNTAGAMATIGNELLKVGGDAVAGPLGVASAYYDVASGVSKVSARMSTLKKSVSLAEAGQANLKTSTSGMIKVMNAYNYSADKAGFAADVFTRTVGKGVGSMDEFVSAMSPIAGLTANVGIGFDKVGQMMAFITAKGQTASAASTQLKSAITSMLNPNQKMIKLLSSMGIESGSTMLKQYGLAQSLSMIKDALGGSQDKMAQVLGSQESLQAAIALTQSDFTDFASGFSKGMEGITDKARAVQLQSIEAKMARLNAASDTMKAYIGKDINQIRGFFMDMKTGFLNNVVNPILGSKVGPVFTQIAAFAGMGTKAVLDMGGSVLNTAAQLSVLTANISNAGGIVKLFKSTLGLLGAPFQSVVGFAKSFVFRLLGIGGASTAAAAGTGTMGAASAASAGGIGVATGATTAFGVSLWAALWPILAVIGAIALIAGGVYLLVKNWSGVSSFFGKIWKGVTGFFKKGKLVIFTILFPFIGLPMLIIKNWGSITSFFGKVWSGITGIFNKGKLVILTILFPFIGIPVLIIKNWSSIKSFFGNLWNGITNKCTNTWNRIKGFFGSIWNGITGIFKKGKHIILTILFPFIGFPMLIVKNWGGIKSFFGNLWDGIVSGFTGAWQGITGFFSTLWDRVKSTVMGFINWVKGPIDTVRNIIGGIGDFFGGLSGNAMESGKGLNTAFASGMRQNAAIPGQTFGNSLKAIDAQLPHSDAKEGPLSRLTESGKAFLNTFAGGMENTTLKDRVKEMFTNLFPEKKRESEFVLDNLFVPVASGADGNKSYSIRIDKLVVHSEDIQSVMDFVRILMDAVKRPEG